MQIFPVALHLGAIIIALSLSSGVLADSEKKNDDSASDTKSKPSPTMPKFSVNPGTTPVLNSKHKPVLPSLNSPDKTTANSSKPANKKKAVTGKTKNIGLMSNKQQKFGGSQQSHSTVPAKKIPATKVVPRDMVVKPIGINILPQLGNTLNKPELNKKKLTGVQMQNVQQVGGKGIKENTGLERESLGGGGMFGSRVRDMLNDNSEIPSAKDGLGLDLDQPTMRAGRGSTVQGQDTEETVDIDFSTDDSARKDQEEWHKTFEAVKEDAHVDPVFITKEQENKDEKETDVLLNSFDEFIVHTGDTDASSGDKEKTEEKKKAEADAAEEIAKANAKAEEASAAAKSEETCKKGSEGCPGGNSTSDKTSVVDGEPDGENATAEDLLTGKNPDKTGGVRYAGDQEGSGGPVNRVVGPGTLIQDLPGRRTINVENLQMEGIQQRAGGGVIIDPPQ